MARIAGVDLPRQKRANIGLTYIYGIGGPRAARILGQANVDPMKKVQDLSEDEVNRIRQVIEAEGMVEGDLRKEVQMNIKRLIEIGSYRGFRHRRNLFLIDLIATAAGLFSFFFFLHAEYGSWSPNRIYGGWQKQTGMFELIEELGEKSAGGKISPADAENYLHFIGWMYAYLVTPISHVLAPNVLFG